MNIIKIFDSTLRDGSHAIKQQLSLQNIADYCREIDDVGVYTVIVGHGNGLGASTLNVGLAKENALYITADYRWWLIAIVFDRQSE